MGVSYKMFVAILFLMLSMLIIQIVEICRKIQTVEPCAVNEEWWGRGDPKKENQNIFAFNINVSDEVINDLHYRLEHVRPFTKPLEDTQWYGFNSDLAQELLDYWKTKYDWRKRENYLNQYPQFTTSIQGLRIRFHHVRHQNIPKNIKILPLLIVHGWPGSVREFYELFPLLTTPQEGRNFVFEVISPDLPGYAFSEAASKPGLGSLEIALVFKNLMGRLGFDKFYVQGGDMGAIVLQMMASHFPEAVLGFHSNMCVSYTPFSILKLTLSSIFPSLMTKEGHEERFYPLSDYLHLLILESGYLHVQATKPDTIGIAMDDSPIGLAAYHLEKFITGGNFDYRKRKDGGLKEKFNYDDLLDHVMLYWINKSATTAYRLYAETFNKRKLTQLLWVPVKVPTACARFKHDIQTPDGILEDIYQNLVQLTDYDGGHFAAFENPELFSKDIFSAISIMETKQ